MAKLLTWKHPGFSALAGEPIAPEQKQHLEDTTAGWPLDAPARAARGDR